MPRVAALYRYPVKGFTPEECDTLTVLDEGRIAGDRVLGIRFADTAAADEAWSKKTEMVALMNTPGLARLHLKFEAEARRLRLSLRQHRLSGCGPQSGRQTAARDRGGGVCAHARRESAGGPPGAAPAAGHWRRPHAALPRRRSRAGDAPRPWQSPRADGGVGARRRSSERRFRSNIALEGLGAWEEHRWVGRKVRIGTVTFDVVRPKVRCLATHANPTTGERDVPILTTLTTVFGQEKPTFGVAMVPSQAGGHIHVGDHVTLVE